MAGFKKIMFDDLDPRASRPGASSQLNSANQIQTANFNGGQATYGNISGHQPVSRQAEPKENMLVNSGATVGQARVSKPEIFQPKASSAGLTDEYAALRDEGKISGGLGRWLILGGIITAVLILGLGGYYTYARLFSGQTESTLEPPPNEPIGSDEAITPPPNEPIADEPAENSDKTNQVIAETATSAAAIIDTDQDGLMDDEEKRLGTNPESDDTDSDGLYDREEVQVYKTNPLKEDTDSDGFIDGEEINGGYNPLGPGRLYDLPVNNEQTDS